MGHSTHLAYPESRCLEPCADDRQHDFHSWVPDLTKPSGCDNTLFYIMHAIHGTRLMTPSSDIYKASGNASIRDRFTETLDPRLAGPLIRVLRPTLCVKALLIEKIFSVTQNLIDGIYSVDAEMSADLQQRMGEIELRAIVALQLRPNPVPLSTLYEEFGTTLFRGNSHPWDSITLAARHERWRGWASPPDPLLPSFSREEILFKAFDKQLQHLLHKSQIFSLKVGGLVLCLPIVMFRMGTMCLFWRAGKHLLY